MELWNKSSFDCIFKFTKVGKILDFGTFQVIIFSTEGIALNNKLNIFRDGIPSG